jgi:hypothetical protein
LLPETRHDAPVRRVSSSKPARCRSRSPVAGKVRVHCSGVNPSDLKSHAVECSLPPAPEPDKKESTPSVKDVLKGIFGR